MYDQFMELAGVDITHGPMDVGPTCHYFMGGVRVDAETGMSTVAGLFATGECSGGMNGANRLGGNSLSDLLVFGKRAGERAAQDAAQAPAAQIEAAQLAQAAGEMTRYLSGPGSEDPYRLHAELQSTMQEDAGIFRDEAGLTAVLNQLREFDRRVSEVLAPSSTTVYNPGWHLCRDLRNMLIVSRAAASSALLRQESRGAHSRLDFPAFDDYWSEHNIVVRQDGEEMLLEPRPVVKAAELLPLVEERKQTERDASKEPIMDHVA
jgi:succinate dehydrogenase / fumarate reductase, flavoprotein subunit